MNRSFVLSLSFFLGACSAESALVGGECRPGTSAESGRCLAPPATTIVPGPAAPPPAPPAVTPAPSTPSSSSSSSSSSSGSVAPEPEPPVVIVTPEPEPTTCADGFVACRGGCLRVDADGQNCGACGRVCPSNICVAGVCQGATPGDVVVIGHDMAAAPSFSTHAKVFTNAVSIPKTDPLRVLAFEADTTDDVRQKTRALTVASNPSRGVRFAVATAPEALEDPNLYASWDVVLVDGVATANAAAFGARWSSALDTFTKQGGVLVALDDGRGDLPAFFDATPLLSLGARVTLAPETPLTVAAPNDVVGVHLLSPYAAFGRAIAYDVLPSANVTWVVTTTADDVRPTVLHKVAR
ncbi:MAG: hypothetical protein KIT84_31350 [Labilithrix sp.]|nr:hypothetical protein [Labilithrix sp.]MCW5815566.1 hypothetical protein [Labilithrix sp.]